MSYLKSEIYKFFCHSFSLFSILSSFLYSALAVYLYHLENNGSSLLYENFIAEFLLLYLVLSVYFTSFTVSEEYLYGTINDLKNIKVIIAKIIISLLFIISIFVFSFLFVYDINFLLGYTNNVVSIDTLFRIIKIFIKLLPMVIALNLLCLLLSIITKKGNLAIIITLVLYIASGYLNKIIISNNLKCGYYMPMMNWNLNELNDMVSYIGSILINLVFIFSLIILIIFLYLKRR